MADTAAAATDPVDAIVTVTETAQAVRGRILAQATLGDGSEEMIVEIRERYTRPVAGSGSWTSQGVIN